MRCYHLGLPTELDEIQSSTTNALFKMMWVQTKVAFIKKNQNTLKGLYEHAQMSKSEAN